MAIFENKQDKTYTLFTKNTMYQMKINKVGMLLHTYYGKKTQYMDMSLVDRKWGTAFSPNMQDVEEYISYNHEAQELSVAGVGDFRLTQLSLRNTDGTLGTEPRFVSAEIINGKFSLVNPFRH